MPLQFDFQYDQLKVLEPEKVTFFHKVEMILYDAANMYLDILMTDQYFLGKYIKLFLKYKITYQWNRKSTKIIKYSNASTQ